MVWMKVPGRETLAVPVKMPARGSPAAVLLDDIAARNQAALLHGPRLYQHTMLFSGLTSGTEGLKAFQQQDTREEVLRVWFSPQLHY